MSTFATPHGDSSAARTFAVAVVFFCLWALATWVFEGRIHALLRPDATRDRLVYALTVNVGLGLGGGMFLLRLWVRRGVMAPSNFSMVPRGRTAVAIFIGLGLGLLAYFLQGAPSTDPIVLLNAFSQVLVVSAAEVVVCWCIVGSAMEQLLQSRGRLLSITGALLVAAAVFGVYHFAHSPPFNTVPMVTLLTGIGIVTGLFFFASRDLAGTVMFHNFLGVFGVVQALAEADALGTFARIQIPLIGMAALTALVIAVGYWTMRTTSDNHGELS